MCNVLIFAGTTEGRMLAEYLDEHGISIYVCVATEYGEKLLPKSERTKVSNRRLAEEEMCALMEEQAPEYVVDATHPYAAEVTKNIQRACAALGRNYIRLIRESVELSDVIYVESAEKAVAYLEETEGNIFLTTGSKELQTFTKLSRYEERLYARVLSLPNVVQSCAELGIEGKHLICMQGPFSKELNTAMLRQTNASYFVTKESGRTGGFPEKYEAAKECQVPLIVIGRPEQESGMTFTECQTFLNETFQILQERKVKVSLVGIGMGDEQTFTAEAKKRCAEAELLIGAKRMLEAAGTEGQDTFAAYQPDVICEYMEQHSEYSQIAVVFSGDTGFFSGAKRLLDALRELPYVETEVLCGVSSMSYFCSRIQLSWENMKAATMHGRAENIIGFVKQYEKVFVLVGDEDGISKICKKLMEYGMGDVTVYTGERLNYADEKIRKGRPELFADCKTDALSVLVIENPDAKDRIVTHGISDEMFLRGKVPMTKEEVRSISVSKMQLKKDSVIYDIGAGTGSVAIEMALQSTEGTVYAVEKKPEAVQLIRENRKKFGADNLIVLEGTAPDMLKDLPVPTHAFIGGSSGNLKQIIELLREKNPNVRIVLNAITLETVSEAVLCLKETGAEQVDIVQISVAKSKEIGSYHMMMGQNPVYIISFGGDAR